MNFARQCAVVVAVWWLLAAQATGAAGEPGPRTADLAREQRMASEIEEAILEGRPMQLHAADGQTFLGIYTSGRETPAKGSIVILHGRGFHPDWPDVVHPLRVGLAEHGWNTLSIQLPVLDKDAKYYDYLEIFDAAMPRIEAAIATAQQLSPGRLVVVAHSCGAHMAQHWMLERDSVALRQVDAFVGIGMGATDYRQPMRVPFALDRLRVPVLDLYAEHDFPAVHRLAGERRAAIRRGGNPKSAQTVVPDADHYFVDRGDVLLEVVAAWLETL